MQKSRLRHAALWESSHFLSDFRCKNPLFATRSVSIEVKKSGFISGHDFQTPALSLSKGAASAIESNGALLAAKNPGFVSGHDFQACPELVEGCRKRNRINGALLAAKNPGFVSGHDFSRAVSTAES
jgi:hypothetical protein